MRVLIVEDEKGIATTLDQYLRRDGYATDVATTGRQALSVYRAARPDLVLLDVMLPELDGFEVLKAIRQESAVPVILLTARSDEVDRLVGLGLGLGADDYVVKPFSFREVVARVKAVLRRTRRPAPDTNVVLRVGNVTIDTGSAVAEYAGRPLDLTATEFRLLCQFAAAPDRVFSRGELIDRALPESDILERTLDSHIKNLRAKLGTCGATEVIQTVRGLGFRLVSDELAASRRSPRATQRHPEVSA